MEEYIYNLIPQDRYITREELIQITGCSDRTVRNAIANIRKNHNVISLTCEKGYRKPRATQDMTLEEREKEIAIMKKQLKENNNRIKKIKYNMKSQIAYLKMLEKSLEGNEV